MQLQVLLSNCGCCGGIALQKVSHTLSTGISLSCMTTRLSAIFAAALSTSSAPPNLDQLEPPHREARRSAAAAAVSCTEALGSRLISTHPNLTLNVRISHHAKLITSGILHIRLSGYQRDRFNNLATLRKYQIGVSTHWAIVKP
jgi:hypothetical protein